MPRWVRLRLSTMFFLNVAVTALYLPLLSLHLSRTLGLSPKEVGVVFAMGPLATLVAPLVVGGLADRVLAAERAAAFVNLARALALLVVGRATTFPEVVGAVLLLGLVSAPGMVLDFTIAFHHSRSSPNDIGKTRVFGTISWIVMLWATGFYFERFQGSTHDLFDFAAALAVVSALHSLTLPHTPPPRGAARPFAFLDAAELLRRRDFRAVIIGAMLGAVCTQFHFVLHPLFYTDKVTGLGLGLAATSFASSVAQFLEVGLFPFLGVMIARFGMRRVLTLGLLAWPLRYLAYLIGGPPHFVIGMQTLHGVNVVYGQIASQIAVERLAPVGARASSQALLQAVSMGAGNLVGQLLCGFLLEASALPNGGYRWPLVFAVPLVLGVIAVIVVATGMRNAPEAVTH